MKRVPGHLLPYLRFPPLGHDPFLHYETQNRPRLKI